jgi:hypothetical protein
LPPRRDASAAPDSDALDATTLARLSGGSLTQVSPTTSSVSFLARTPDTSTPPAPVEQHAAEPIDTTPFEPEPPNEDELYDRIVRRLRRELLDERERRGRAIGDGRW